MQGGFRQSRYASDKFEAITAEAKKDGERKPRSSDEIRDLVKDPVKPLGSDLARPAVYYGPSF